MNKKKEADGLSSEYLIDNQTLKRLIILSVIERKEVIMGRLVDKMMVSTVESLEATVLRGEAFSGCLAYYIKGN